MRPKECSHYQTRENVLKPSENLLKVNLEAVLFFTRLFLLSFFQTIHVVNISDPEECFNWKPEQNKKMWLNLKVFLGKKTQLTVTTECQSIIKCYKYPINKTFI